MHNRTTTKIEKTPCLDISGKASESNERTKSTWCPGYQIDIIILSLYKKQPKKQPPSPLRLNNTMLTLQNRRA